MRMRLWYLTCRKTQEYAVVFAKSKNAAFERLIAYRKVETDDYDLWDIEEFTEESYDGVLYFY